MSNVRRHMPRFSRMLRLSLASVVATCALGCTQQPLVAVADGRSPQTAILIVASQTPESILSAQREWFGRNLPGAKPDFSRSRYTLSTRVIQAVPAAKSDQTEVLVFFDVTPQ
jgi:hypothetical protein